MNEHDRGPGASSALASQTAVSVDGISVEFATERGTVTALRDLSITIDEGDFLTILGPSGCGKSSFLRAVADLVAPSTGSLTLFGRSPGEARSDREIGFVFQDAALLPWRTVRSNVALPLEIGKGRGSSRPASSPDELLSLVGLQGREDAYPHELSGGMRQRVSIARALVTGPRLLLMDEPFGALDQITRDRLNEELLRFWEESRTTVLFVTHSIDEALFLGQKVLVLAANPGRVREIVEVDLPRSRTLAIKETDGFVRQSAHLRAVLETC